VDPQPHQPQAGTAVAVIGRSLMALATDSTTQPDYMKASTRNKNSGTANIVKGKTKAAAGKVTGNRTLQAKGRAQEFAGKVQRSVGARQKARGN
jgi:uncharacterized protein YjbJ (UPF0337 family)